MSDSALVLPRKVILSDCLGDICVQVAAYLESKAAMEDALQKGANELFGRFSKHFSVWNRAICCAAELDCLVSLALASSAPGMCRLDLFGQSIARM